MKLKTLFLSLSLYSCAALPDEVSVGGFTSEYDFLGANSLKGDGNETGTNQGVMLTATYKLKPQSIVIQNLPQSLNQYNHKSFKPEEEYPDPVISISDSIEEETKRHRDNMCLYILTIVGTLISGLGVCKVINRKKRRKVKGR